MRLFVDAPLVAGADLALPPGASRHAQVRRVQPGDALLLFDGGGCDWPAEVLAMGRSEVRVRVGEPHAVHTELPLAVTLALAMPANERMDSLVEQATQLGVARLQPLLAERSVLRLAGERAERKRAHWQAVAEAACEQCGRARIPVIAPVRTLADWLAGLKDEPPATRLLLSLAAGAAPLPRLIPQAPAAGGSLCTLSGPEGGLAPDEEAAARAAGFVAVGLGPRVLRAETAPLAVLAWLALHHTEGS
ncbi:Ribosomal RNA small subunit methyltransferase E [Rubrivivax sp. A210]|uniref:16S rRNA (uracil(1498)-N(3))-methyltransferase n=1 Tax=Rubrivivax sp. A210 TaxID=2772301 RepID=UPI001919BBEA|nr:16S rRNA (uracil(1498)-N(3))-methyltransferase [Rubrivivax sp. A210]CAD5373225.1 Ribosomal RNA small subunit methyltransferase E [Rubrivivax sp. A210]